MHFFLYRCISPSAYIDTSIYNTQSSLYGWIILYAFTNLSYIPHSKQCKYFKYYEMLSVYFSPLEISRMSHTFPSHFGKESFLACRERGSDTEISTESVYPLSVLAGICSEEMLTQAAFYIKYIPVAQGSAARCLQCCSSPCF